MNSLERIILNVAHRCSLHHAEEIHEPEAAIKASHEEESLYLLRLAAIDAEERRHRQIMRDGRRAIKLGCE